MVRAPGLGFVDYKGLETRAYGLEILTSPTHGESNAKDNGHGQF